MDYTSPSTWGPEVILVLGDLWIPDKVPELQKKFSEVLRPGKITSVVCTGNLVNEDTYDWLRTISTDVLLVKGSGDTFHKVTDDYKTKVIGGVKIGLINGYQLPSLSKEDILAYNGEFKECGVVIYGSTHQSTFDFDKNEQTLFLNPGSCTGAPDKDGNPTTPSCYILCPIVDSKETEKVTGFVCFKYELKDNEVKVSKSIVLTQNYKKH